MESLIDNRSITEDTRPSVERLARFAARPDVVRALVRAVREARATLAREPDVQSVFEPIDLSTLKEPACHPIASARVVVTRGTGSTHIERHANSTQYLLAIDGPIETRVATADGWRVDRYGEGPAAVLENRWHVVPINTWHRSNAPECRDWSVAAFHTARDVSDEYQPASS